MDNVVTLQMIRACQRREPAAEEALFRLFAPKVLSITRRYASDEHQSLDYLQECFIVIFEKMGAYDPRKGAFEPWARRLCINVILQILRKNRRLPQLQEVADLPAEEPEASPWDCLSEETILQALRNLPSGYREVFNLHVFESWSHREIAEALGISESASRSQLTRARQVLKHHLEQIIRKYEQGLVG